MQVQYFIYYIRKNQIFNKIKPANHLILMISRLQVVNKYNIKDRILFYWSKLYTKDLKAGEDYEKLEKKIVILIADFNISGLEEVGYHST